MNTHYLGGEEVRAYSRDLVRRIRDLGNKMPRVWIPIGRSGREILKKLLEVDPELDSRIVPVPAEFDRDHDHKATTARFEKGAKARITGKNVLVMDGAVHSGRAMLSVVRKASELGAAGVFSYTLVLKRSSVFVPSFWGVTIDDHDRAFFLLEELPNNRFTCAPSGPEYKPPQRTPNFHIRMLMKQDLELPKFKCGLKSLDRLTWSDYYYDMVNSDRDFWIYLLEVGTRIAGYVSFSLRDGGWLSVESVAVRRVDRGKGYASALMRWAETNARQFGCEESRLWAIEREVHKYEHLGWKKVQHEEPLCLDDGRYHRMCKRILYHLKRP
ncbi:MAG: GNAT family N-acetyltransferase [Phycisphaerae bacterium]|nr:GNAT family N-acetyltransferase [Phycisphaerae bacterium]